MEKLKANLKKFSNLKEYKSKKFLLVPLFIIVFIFLLYIFFNRNNSTQPREEIIMSVSRDDQSDMVLKRVNDIGILEVIRKDNGEVLQKVSVEGENVSYFTQSNDRFFVAYVYSEKGKQIIRGFDFDKRTYVTLNESEIKPIKIAINNPKTLISVTTEENISVIKISDASYKNLKGYEIFTESSGNVYIPDSYWDPAGTQITVQIKEKTSTSNKIKTYLINVENGGETLIYEGIENQI